MPLEMWCLVIPMLAVLASLSARKLNEPPDDPVAFNRKYDKLFQVLGAVVWLGSPALLVLLIWWLL